MKNKHIIKNPARYRKNQIKPVSPTLESSDNTVTSTIIPVMVEMHQEGELQVFSPKPISESKRKRAKAKKLSEANKKWYQSVLTKVVGPQASRNIIGSALLSLSVSILMCRVVVFVFEANPASHLEWFLFFVLALAATWWQVDAAVMQSVKNRYLKDRMMYVFLAIICYVIYNCASFMVATWPLNAIGHIAPEVVEYWATWTFLMIKSFDLFAQLKYLKDSNSK